MEEAEADTGGSLEQGLAGPRSDKFWEEVRSRGDWLGARGGGWWRLAQVPEVQRSRNIRSPWEGWGLTVSSPYLSLHLVGFSVS